jgi:hypothetical protein
MHSNEFVPLAVSIAFTLDAMDVALEQELVIRLGVDAAGGQ